LELSTCGGNSLYMRRIGRAFRALNAPTLQFYSLLLKEVPRALAEELLRQIEQGGAERMHRKSATSRQGMRLPQGKPPISAKKRRAVLFLPLGRSSNFVGWDGPMDGTSSGCGLFLGNENSRPMMSRAAEWPTPSLLIRC
jgi:hypothetical protein